MKFCGLFLFFTFLSLSVSAQRVDGDGAGNNLTVTCGENAYEALEEGKASLAELFLVLKTRGPNNPPKLIKFQDDFSLISNIRKLDYVMKDNGTISITVELSNFDSYEFTGLKNCHDINKATGNVLFNEYTGGFAGSVPASRAKCSCLIK